jgi:hypothetical protein
MKMKIIKETEKAVRVMILSDNSKQYLYWLPKSVATISESTINIAGWFMNKMDEELGNMFNRSKYESFNSYDESEFNLNVVF